MANNNPGNSNENIQTPESFEIASGRRQQARWREVEVPAPYVEVPGRDPILRAPGDDYNGPTGRGVVFRNEAVIDIRVRELQGNELGALADPNKLPGYMERAIERKSAEDKAAYGMTTAEMRDQARRDGYFGSQAHIAWSEAAEARTGGRISAEWWRNFDPYGGTNGNGPNILDGGQYPHPLSRIGMAHDTDWSLGRHFQAGPMRALYGANYDAETLGKYGLDPTSPIRPRTPDNYLQGHRDWDVDYQHRSQRRSQNEGETVVATGDANLRNNPVFQDASRLLAGLDANRTGLDTPEKLDLGASRLTAAMLTADRNATSLNWVDFNNDGTKLIAGHGSKDNPSTPLAVVDVKDLTQGTIEQNSKLVMKIENERQPTQVAEQQHNRSVSLS